MQQVVEYHKKRVESGKFLRSIEGMLMLLHMRLIEKTLAQPDAITLNSWYGGGVVMLVAMKEHDFVQLNEEN